MAFSLCSCGGQSIEEQYAAIKTELENTETLQKNYFAKYYDMNDLEKAKSDAEMAVEKSDEENYGTVLAELQSQNNAFSAYISSEVDKLYNAQTSDGEYPFAVDVQDVSVGFYAELLVKQTSSHPHRVDINEPTYTDESPYAHLWIDGSSRTYDYRIRNVKTKEIKVENENGEIEKALVNTQIKFTLQNRHPVNMGEEEFLNERPGYLFEDKDGYWVLALKNYDNKDYYVLYACYDSE